MQPKPAAYGDARINCDYQISMSVGAIPEKMRETANRVAHTGGL
jgi:hypothetical protein